MAVKLRLLATSDLHMFVYDFDYYAGRQDNTVGLGKVATLLRQARGEARNSLLFDNGDILQGNPLGDFMALPGAVRADHPMIRAMNRLGYDAATFGNHEFNYGLDVLGEALGSACFPFVCANIETVEGGRWAPPTTVLQREVIDEAGLPQTLRIGVIGLVTPQIMVWDKARLQAHIRTIDIVEAARRHLPALRAASDLVVALSHSGISDAPHEPGAENASLPLAALPEIDVVISGHAHRVFPGPDYAGLADVDAVRGTLAGKPAVMPGFWGSHLGVVDLTLRRDGGGWRIADFAVEVLPICRREGARAVPLADNDPRVLTAVAPEHRATLRWMEQPVGHTTRPIDSFFALVGGDVSLPLVNAAQLWYARPLLEATRFAALPVLSAASPFKSGGQGANAYVDIPAGPLTMRAIASLYMFANTLCAVRVTGHVLREWLERACVVFNRIDLGGVVPQKLRADGVPSYMFDVISGLTYTIDPTQPARYDLDGQLCAPASHRIVDLRHQGRPVDPAQDFIVVTNNYRADGGGHFPGTGAGRIVLAAPDLTRDVLVRYVTRHTPLTPRAEPVWRFARPARPVRLAFDGNADTARHLGSHPGVTRIGETTDGTVRYGFTLS